MSRNYWPQKFWHSQPRWLEDGQLIPRCSRCMEYKKLRLTWTQVDTYSDSSTGPIPHMPKIMAIVNLPHRNTYPPRNKGLIAFLIKGNQWSHFDTRNIGTRLSIASIRHFCPMSAFQVAEVSKESLTFLRALETHQIQNTLKVLLKVLVFFFHGFGKNMEKPETLQCCSSRLMLLFEHGRLFLQP